MGDLTVSTPANNEEHAEAPVLGGERASFARVSTLAGDGTEGYVDGSASEARFYLPRGVAIDGAGNVYVADTGNNRIRKISPDGSVSTLAGDGAAGHADGPGDRARFAGPRALVVDGAGNVIVGDTNNDRIRKITPQGMVSTFSGEGVRGFADGARAAARFYHPNGIAFDRSGNLIVCDASNRRIRKVSPGGTVSTLAGGDVAGYADGIGGEARFSCPLAIAVDAANQIYVAEHGNSRIRKISQEGRVTPFAGDGRGCHADGLGTAASFKDPCGLAVDAAGNVYVADSDNHCIRKIGQDGVVVTIAGDGKSVGDFADGSGAMARFSSPRGLCVSPTGPIYVADTMNHCIRVITID